MAAGGGRLVDAVKAAVAPTIFGARNLCVEVTESTVMDEVEVAIALLGTVGAK